jgi:hypothetical protein
MNIMAENLAQTRPATTLAGFLASRRHAVAVPPKNELFLTELPFLKLLRLYAQMTPERRAVLLEAASEIAAYKNTWADTTPLGGLETSMTDFDPQA